MGSLANCSTDLYHPPHQLVHLHLATDGEAGDAEEGVYDVDHPVHRPNVLLHGGRVHTPGFHSQLLIGFKNHSDQMSQRSQVSRIALLCQKSKGVSVSDQSVSDKVTY